MLTKVKDNDIIQPNDNIDVIAQVDDKMNVFSGLDNKTAIVVIIF